ncbi:MAG: hypothetical protein WKF59_08560 [Chitinophagaceae bacterium]
MGDTGSLLIGLLNSIFAIKFMAVASHPDAIFPYYLLLQLLLQF